MVFDISAGLRRGDAALLEEIETALDRNRARIGAILAEYGVLRLDRPEIP